jgi:hypothetical protein
VTKKKIFDLDPGKLYFINKRVKLREKIYFLNLRRNNVPRIGKHTKNQTPFSIVKLGLSIKKKYVKNTLFFVVALCYRPQYSSSYNIHSYC